MNAEALLDLAARCEAAATPDRALDAEIAAALGFAPQRNAVLYTATDSTRARTAEFLRWRAAQGPEVSP